MGAGSVYKRCSCRVPVLDSHGTPVVDGRGQVKMRRVGATCPDLRRPDGAFNPRHGIWQAQIQAPAAPDGKRVIIRRGRFGDRHAAQEFLFRSDGCGRWLTRSRTRWPFAPR